jgi:hypothetical protein
MSGKIRICVAVALFSAALAVMTNSLARTTAHSGTTDSAGCHSDATTYHCHSGLLAGCAFQSQADMVAQVQRFGGRPPNCTPIPTTTTGTTTGTTTPTTPASLFFPQIADGHFTDGTYYRSTMLISSKDGAEASGCSLELQGMTATFDGLGTGRVFKFDIDSKGWLITSTPGVEDFRFGYATLTCDVAVNAQIVYAFYDKAGRKISEAAVLPSDSATTVTLFADNREGGRLALAIANPSSAEAKYQITVSAPEGGELNSGSITLAAKTSTARFLDEVVEIPPDYFGQVVITSAEKVYAMGLRFTGPLFTSIPATARVVVVKP